MTYVVTLIPPAPIMPPALISQLLAILEEKQAFPNQIDWLKPQRVVDLWFGSRLDAPLQQFLYEFAEQYHLDIFIQQSQNRHFNMLISDMDSTMITVECIDELADYVGKKDAVSRITERAMNGELDFAAALTERVAILAGLNEADLESCYRERVTFMSGARELVQCMKRQSAYCLLISGGFDFFTARVAAHLGFDAHQANCLELVEGVLTGRVIAPILGKEAKLASLQAEASRLGISPTQIMAVGDGANDVPMLLAAGCGVAYHAKSTVKRQAKHAVDYNDLTALIYAQGLSA